MLELCQLILLYCYIIIRVSITMTLLQLMAFLPMCIEPFNTAVLILSHYSARTHFVILTWHVLVYVYIMAATTLS